MALIHSKDGGDKIEAKRAFDNNGVVHVRQTPCLAVDTRTPPSTNLLDPLPGGLLGRNVDAPHVVQAVCAVKAPKDVHVAAVHKAGVCRAGRLKRKRTRVKRRWWVQNGEETGAVALCPARLTGRGPS